MSAKTTLPASGLSVAVGIGNTSSLSTLRNRVEELRALLAQSTPQKNQDVNLFGSRYIVGSTQGPENPDITELFNRISDLESEMSEVKKMGLEAVTIGSGVDETTKKIKNLDKSVTNLLFDVEALLSISPSAADFVAKWDSFAEKAYVDEDESILHVKDCNLGFVKNAGDKSSLHFSGLEDPNWSIYTSSRAGKSTDGNSPPSHSGVNNTATRIRVGSNPRGGVIIETPEKSLLHIEPDGKTKTMSTSSGDMGSPSSGIGGFSHNNCYNATDFAVSQDNEGCTKINSKAGNNLFISGNNRVFMTVDSGSSKTMEIKNNNQSPTSFNIDGKNIISSGSKTSIRSGTSNTDILSIEGHKVSVKGVLYIDDISVNEMIRVLKFRVSEAEKKWK